MLKKVKLNKILEPQDIVGYSINHHHLLTDRIILSQGGQQFSTQQSALVDLINSSWNLVSLIKTNIQWFICKYISWLTTQWSKVMQTQINFN